MPVAGFTLLSTLTLTPGWDMPQFVNFQASELPSVIISLGNDAPMMKYQGSTGFSKLSSKSVAADGAARWQANHFYTIGDRIAAPDFFTSSNGKLATWQVVNVTIGASTVGGAQSGMSNTSGVGGGGLSGTTIPNFANTNSGIHGTGETIADNQVIWMDLKEEIGLAKQATPHGAAHIIKHANCLWAWNTAPASTSVGGSIDGPSVLRMSGPNDADQWPLVNTTLIGQDDGTQGTGLATFTIAEAGITPTANLVVFKDYSTYVVNGVFQAQDFSVNQIKSDMGCTAPRSIAFATAWGVFRFCHIGFAWFDGVNDHILSEDIRPYIYGDKVTPGVDFTRLSKMRGTLVANPPLYVCSAPTTDGNVTRIFCYDIVMKAWMVVDYLNGGALGAQYPITTMAQLRPRSSIGGLSVVGDDNATTVLADFGPGNVASIRRWQAGTFHPEDTAWDATYPPTPIRWSFRPAEVGEPGSRAYFRRANVRLNAPQPGTLTGFFNVGEEQLPINVQPETGAGPSSGVAPNGTAFGTMATRANYFGNEDLGVALDIHQTGPSLNGTYTGSGPASVEGVDYHINAKNPRPFGQRF